LINQSAISFRRWCPVAGKPFQKLHKPTEQAEGRERIGEGKGDETAQMVCVGAWDMVLLMAAYGLLL
jgi:hypothetical protein